MSQSIATTGYLSLSFAGISPVIESSRSGASLSLIESLTVDRPISIARLAMQFGIVMSEDVIVERFQGIKFDFIGFIGCHSTFSFHRQSVDVLEVKQIVESSSPTVSGGNTFEDTIIRL